MPLLALVLVAAALLPAAVQAQVRGHITDARSGEPVGGALVQLSGQTLHLTSSAADGAYLFAGPPAGSYCIRVHSPGYDQASVCISVSASASMSVDLPLTPRPVVIEPLIVASAQDARRVGSIPFDSLQSGQRLALLENRSRELAGALLSDLVQNSVDDQAGGQNPHTLYVWGSSAERGRVLLDGATVNAPLHLGALMPPLDPDVIGAADLRSGGISPRYDGGTAYIMDFTTRAGADERRLWGELDPLAARIGVESPINGRGRVIMSARRVNDEIIEGLVSPGFGYGYADGLARADLELGEHAVYLTGLATHEAVNIPRDISEDRASWDNRVATLGWRLDRNSDTRSAALTVSRGVADLPLLSAPGGHLAASLDRYSALAQRRWSAGALRWDAGAEFEHLVFRRRSRADQDPTSDQPGPVECTALLPCSHSRATLVSAFGQLSLQPAPGIVTTFGTRTMFDFNAQQLHVLPRVSVTLLPSQRYAVTIAAGRFSQAYVRETPVAPGNARADLPIDVDVAHATHLELGVARHSTRLFLKAGAYLRLHERAEPATHARTVPGADLSFEYTTDFGALSMGYSISGNPQPASAGTGGRALMQQLAAAAFNRVHGRWRIDVSAAYGSGLPLTSIVLEQPTETEPLWLPASSLQPGSRAETGRSNRNYLRVDASLAAEWSITPGGRNMRLVPYARIINALSQRESLFYFQNSGDPTQPPRPLASLPAVPVVGVRWYF